MHQWDLKAFSIPDFVDLLKIKSEQQSNVRREGNQYRLYK